MKVYKGEQMPDPDTMNALVAAVLADPLPKDMRDYVEADDTQPSGSAT